MNQIMQTIGQRVRACRTQQKLSQEQLAELAGVHPTYIGQIERGEKNLTLESLFKVTNALSVSPSRLLEKLGEEQEGLNYPLRCYELVSTYEPAIQKKIFEILSAICSLPKA